MINKNIAPLVLTVSAALAAQPVCAEGGENTLDAVVVWGVQKASEQAGYTSPTSTLTPDDLAGINMATTEDAVKHEPSIVIRRRFIGDSNGTMGMRGSNMFQTSRSMVFADGVPLHYLLESRWNGAPRWSMVSASEIAQVDVMYGPFSAEYGGNSMGGVVNIETKIPQKREVHLDGMIFSQSFDAYGYDDSINGYKGFISYGNKIGNLSVYASYNHLDNEAQPQNFRAGSISTSVSGTTVSGGIVGNDADGNEKMYYGDSGVVDTTTDNFKIKLGYDFGNWFALLNLAYEDRNSQSVGNSYVQDGSGNTLWSGVVDQVGQFYTISGSSLSASERDRYSLNTALRLKGDLNETTQMEVNLSSFDVLKDETRTSAVNPNDPSFTGAGEVLDYDETGWQTAEAKWTFDELAMMDGLSMVTGLRHEAYSLNVDVYDSNNYAQGRKNALSDSSGGESSLNAAFGQMSWAIDERWDTSFGLRYEAWKSGNGYFANDDAGTPELDLVHVPSRSEKRTSPKFSLGLKPADDWVLRYSIAKAYRFPIVEELYSQFEAFTSKSLATPDLEPENGLHHNVMIERGVANGYLRVNLYRESIKDVIEAQTDTTVFPSVRTFVPVDEVQTTGIELIANVDQLFVDKLDVRFNAAYTDSEIVKNSVDASIEGNRFPRMPKWRSNLLAIYHLNSVWDVGGSLQYASDSYGRLDNADNEDQVYGAQDGYTFVGLKMAYKVNPNTKVGVGVDNLTDEVAYVAHPWPQRTFYINASYDMAQR